MEVCTRPRPPARHDLVKQNDWDDISDSESQPGDRPPGTTSDSATTVGSGVRRRYHRQTALASPALARTRGRRRGRAPVVDRDRVQNAVVAGVWSSVEYIFAVVETSIRHLRWPLSVFLSLWMLS